MDAAKVEQAMEETGLQLQVKCHESWDKFCDVVEAKGTYGPKAAEFLRRIVVDAPVVLGFAFVCCAVFFVNVVAPGTNVFVACPPFRMASPLNPLTYLRLLTHTVGHTGYDHLKGNMVNLLLVGPASEKEFGSMNLLKIMFYVAVSSAVAHMALGPANGYQLGASGVVFALILLNSLLSAHSGVVPLTFLLTAGLWVLRVQPGPAWSVVAETRLRWTPSRTSISPPAGHAAGVPRVAGSVWLHIQNAGHAPQPTGTASMSRTARPPAMLCRPSMRTDGSRAAAVFGRPAPMKKVPSSATSTRPAAMASPRSR